MGHVPLLYSICSRHHHPDSLPSQPSYIAHHDPPSLWMFLWPTWQWMPLQKSQMLCPMLVASKHVVLPCGVLNIHCHHHQSVKVCCSLEHPLYKWRQYFHGMLAQTSIALPLLPIVPSQFCQVIMLRVPWGLLQLQSQLPVLALQSLMEQFISWIFHPDEPCKNWSILPPLDQLTGSSLSSFSGLSFRLSPLWYHRLYPSLDYETAHGHHWCSIAFCGWLKKRRVH